MKTRAAVAAVAALVGGCAAPSSLYLPVDHGGATLPSGQPAARYLVPPDHPEGVVEVGTLETHRRGEAREVTVRLRLDNRSPEAWSFDPTSQRLTIEGRSRATAPSERWRVTVPPHSKRTIDLNFTVGGPSPPTSFRLAWEVATPLAIVRLYSAFRLAPVREGYTAGPPLAGDGYFYQPFYQHTTLPPHSGFQGPREYTRAPRQRYPPGQITVPATPPIESAPMTNWGAPPQ